MDNSTMDARGKFKNAILDSDRTRGIKSKLNQSQNKERVELHAQRRTFGSLTIAQIAAHWMEKYQISMHQQSEKEWALNNTDAIDEFIANKIDSGEWKPPIITDQSLSNTLAVAAKYKADIVKNVKLRLNRLLDSTFDKQTMDDKKAITKIGIDLSKISKSESESLMEMIKVAGEFNKRKSSNDQLIEQKAREIVQYGKQKASKQTEEEKFAETFEIEDVEAIRTKAGIVS